MGIVNKLSTTTKLEPSHEIEILQSLTDPKENSNDIAIRSGSNLRVIAIKYDTYDALRKLASQTNNRKTFDGVIRKCIEGYKTKNT